MHDHNIDRMVDKFYNILQKIFVRYIPQATPRANNLPVWFDKNLLNLRNIRNREYKKLQSHRKINANANGTKFITAKTNFESYQNELCNSEESLILHTHTNEFYSLAVRQLIEGIRRIHR